MEQLTNVLTTALAFVFALGVIIIVHEAGHLLVAKAFGVRVLTFSVGFGKRLWGFRRGETEYRVAAVPLGGYVRLGGENPDEVSDDPREFLNKPRWQRILVYLAGPVMNVLLAIALFALLFMVGIVVTDPARLANLPPAIGGVEEGSSAAQAGLQRGDLVLKAGGEPVDNWRELLFALLESPERPVPLEVRRGERTFTTTVTPGRVPRHDVGDFAGLLPNVRVRIIEVVKGEPADRAGFLAGDEILSVDGIPIATNEDFTEALSKLEGRPAAIEISRGGRRMVLPVTARHENGVSRVGVSIGISLYERYGPAQAVVESVKYNVEIVHTTFVFLGKVLSRQLPAKGTLTGPIGIAQESGRAARRGPKELLHLMGFISISIAIMNLLPIPLLDGGQILILLVESVIRRDLSLRFKELVSQVGFVLILMLMLTVIWFDLVKIVPERLLPGSSPEQTPASSP